MHLAEIGKFNCLRMSGPALIETFGGQWDVWNISKSLSTKALKKIAFNEPSICAQIDLIGCTA